MFYTNIVSVIIPVYNEKNTILEILKRIENVHLSLEKEIIIVDDGSTDGTIGMLKTLDKKKYKIILKDKNEGKGAALKAGIGRATGDIVIFQDADLEYEPQDYTALIKPILDGKTKAVLGVRMEPRHDTRRRWLMYWLSWIGNKCITWTTNILYGNNALEYEGCYRAFTKSLLDSIKVRADSFAFDNELVCKILKRGHNITDVPIHYYPRGYSEGKKINWRDGFIILWTIIKYRFVD